MKNSSANAITGWLISPEGKWCYRFHKDPNSWERYPFVFVDKWSAKANGKPSQMKARNKVPMEEALELCGQMLLEGWQAIKEQFDEEEKANLSDELAA